MKRLNPFILTAVLLITWPCVCFSQNQETQEISAISQSPKLIRPQEMMAPFKEGESTARVIVTLKKPVTANGLNNMKSPEIRQTLSQMVQNAQANVLKDLTPNEVQVTNRFTYIFGFSASVTLQGLQALIDNPDVTSIEKDEILHAHLAQGIPLMNATTPRSSYNGSGVSVAICDTGIDYSHPRLGNGGFPNSKVIGGYDTGQNKADPIDGNGHGTACAGIVAGSLGTTGDYIGGVAYSAKLYALKMTYNSTGGSAYSSDMIEAWEWCITHQNDNLSNPIMIISTSFGGGRYYSTCDSASSAMTTAASNAVSAGMTLFVSSGNDGYCDSMGWPACISHVVSVGAVYDAAFTASAIGWCVSSSSCATKFATWGCSSGYYSSDVPQADKVTAYSNTASFLSILAPSNWATTTKMGGGYWTSNYGFGGTSAACPYAAGAAASLQSANKSINGSFLTAAQVKSTLSNTGDAVTDGKVSITKPRVNLQSAVATLNSNCPESKCPSNGIIDNVTYSSGTNCTCTHATALSIGANVIIRTGATVTFRAPVVTFQPGFHAESGATVTVTQ